MRAACTRRAEGEGMMVTQRFTAADCGCKNCPMEGDMACPRNEASETEAALAETRARLAHYEPTEGCEEAWREYVELRKQIRNCTDDADRVTLKLAAARADAVRDVLEWVEKYVVVGLPFGWADNVGAQYARYLERKEPNNG
jgi:hypothetical protein